MATVKVKMNIWGNYVCMIGRERDFDCGSEFDSIDWLSDRLDEGHTLSSKSDISVSQINQWRARLGMAPVAESQK